MLSFQLCSIPAASYRPGSGCVLQTRLQTGGAGTGSQVLRVAASRFLASVSLAFNGRDVWYNRWGAEGRSVRVNIHAILLDWCRRTKTTPNVFPVAKGSPKRNPSYPVHPSRSIIPPSTLIIPAEPANKHTHTHTHTIFVSATVNPHPYIRVHPEHHTELHSQVAKNCGIEVDSV